jgi:hypothetical protein
VLEATTLSFSSPLGSPLRNSGKRAGAPFSRPLSSIIRPAAAIINSLLLLYWFVPVYLVLLFFNQTVSRPPNHSNCPFIAGGPLASSDINLTKLTVG